MTAPDRPPGPEGGPIAETIARVRELDAAATKGPWHTEPYCDNPDDSCRNDSDVGCDGIWADDRRDEIVTTDSAVYGPRWSDAQLIVYYRTAAPLLAAECERLRAELEMIRDAAADAIRDNEHVGFTVRTLHVLRTIKL